MMRHAVALVLALASTRAFAAPLESRQNPAPGVCGATETKPGVYLVNNNLWAADQVPPPPAGQQAYQCTDWTKDDESGVAWSSQFNWPAGTSNGNPISYAYSAVPLSSQPAVGSITKMPTQVQWSYSAAPKGDVAYDVFTAKNPAQPKYPTGDFEIMVWLDKWGGVMPKSNGLNAAVESNLAFGPYTFDLWYGTDANQETFTFVATSSVTSFDADLQPFIQHLLAKYPQFSSDQLLTGFQFGSEVWSSTGVTTFSVPSFSGSVQ